MTQHQKQIRRFFLFDLFWKLEKLEEFVLFSKNIRVFKWKNEKKKTEVEHSNLYKITSLHKL